MSSPRLVRAGLLAALACLPLLWPVLARAGAPGWEAAGTETTELWAARSTVGAGEPGSRSASKAFLFSFLGTAVPIGVGSAIASSGEINLDDAGPTSLVLGGFVVGPSLGHFYAGKSGRALAGIGIRTAAILGMAVSVGESWDHQSTGADVLGGVSLGVGCASVIFDIATAGNSAKKHNRLAGGNRICLAPALIGSAPGLRLDLGL
ncbi:MAG TPA: hypothetical protein VET83_10575 [Candidatus Dormibacteraeota bacterium]|nr:hypothetical protein [Candidatus Dormibacteraeota bacterium]